MARRFRNLVLVLAIGCVLLTPQLILADDGLTLESLAEKVGSLFQGHESLKVRVAAIETSIAPTPTQTPRPTRTPRPTPSPQAGPTATARAKATAQSLFRSRATATAIARSRATATATSQRRQSPTAAEIATYSLATEPVLDLLKEGIFGVVSLFEEPQIGNMAWEFKVEGFVHKIQESWFLALRIDPPSSLSAVNLEFMRGMDACLSGANNVLDGLVLSKPNLLEDAFEEFDKCAQHIEEASEMLDAMQR